MVAKNNLFDGTGTKTIVSEITGNGTSSHVGIVGFEIDKSTSNLELIGNTFKKISRFGRINNHTEMLQQTANVLIDKNRVEGVSYIKFAADESADGANDNNALITHLRLTDNFFKSTADVLLFNGYNPNGTLWASDNVWYTTIPAGDPNAAATLFNSGLEDDAALDPMDREVFISNVISGQRTVNSISLPPANVKIVKKNVLKSGNN